MSFFLSIAIVQLIAVMTPGPDFFFVSQTAVSRSRREAMAGVLGIVLGVAFWSALALLGLQLVLHKLVWLGRGIEVAGGLYLCWMGLNMLRAALGKRPVSAAATADLSANGSLWGSFIKGLLTNLSNPKAIIYFGSVFSAFLGDGLSSGARWGIWGMIQLETLLWFSVVTRCFAMPVMRRGYLRLGRWIDGVAGGVFVLFGLHLMLARRGV